MKLNKCTALQDLAIRILIDDMHSEESDMGFESLVAILSTVPPNLHHLKLEVDVDEFYDSLEGAMMSPHWGRIDGVLQHHKSLQKVDIVLVDRDANGTHSGRSLGRVIRVIEDRLPGLKTRGTLDCIDKTKRNM